MPTGVYCGVGNHDACMLPSCACRCHTRDGAHEFLSALPPRAQPPRALPVDERGQRVCACCGRAYPKRTGPGRYPKCHDDCAAVA